MVKFAVESVCVFSLSLFSQWNDGKGRQAVSQERRESLKREGKGDVRVPSEI